MTTPLRILHLEDSVPDAELVMAALQQEIPCRAERVETRPDFEAALDRGLFDIVISDFSLPSFDGLSALSISRAKAPDIPFLFVSGTIGEDRAIESLKAGATDYVLKHRLSRLVPAVRRAVEEKTERMARRQAERSRAEAESLFRALFDQVAVGVAIEEINGSIAQSNPVLTKLLGYSWGELKGRTLDEMTHLDDKANGGELLRELRAGKRTSFDVEKRFIRKDGSTLVARVVSSSIDGPPGSARFIVNLIEDIAQRKEFETQLRQAQKMETVGRLAAGVAHDFNNFLTAINGYSDLLLRRVPDDRMRAMVQQIRAAGERASTLCARLLAFSRQQTPRPECFDLNAILRELEPMLGQIAGERVRLKLELKGAEACIHADRIQVEQAVINLISNARDAMPEGGEIAIRTECTEVGGREGAQRVISPGDYVVLDVEDTGQGMDEDTKSRIFEPFFTTKEAGKGTGLGLWMVHETVQQIQGWLEVQSVRGAGTRFRFFLPHAVDKEASALAELCNAVGNAPHAVASAPNSPGKKATIVIVDDDHAVRHFLESTLTEVGYSVLTACNGRQALELLRTEKSALLITDLVMPEQEGIETIMTARKEFPDLRILAMSGSRGTPYLRIAKQVGAHAILGKPFDGAKALEIIKGILESPMGTLPSKAASEVIR